MPTIISHAAVPLAIGLGLGQRVIPPRLLIAGVLASMLPDLDVLGLRLGIAYGDTWGHRGVTHSVAFALFVAFVAMLLHRPLHAGRAAAFMFVGASTLSHGVLDMFTDGTHGVELWWPLSTERFVMPWHVIEASPLSLQRVFSSRGLEVFQSELMWVWLPSMSVCLAAWFMRRVRFKASSPGARQLDSPR
jgi:inner membrane protein